LSAPAEIFADGQWHHDVDVIGKRRGNHDGAYKLFDDCRVGILKNYPDGKTVIWHAKESGRKLTRQERSERKAADAKLRRKSEKELVDAQENTARGQAASFFGPYMVDCDGSESYLKRKRVGAYGLRKSASLYAGEIVYMPLRDAAGKFWSAQEL
jgi:phage/plasmid primase-like uncharacterized protein